MPEFSSLKSLNHYVQFVTIPEIALIVKDDTEYTLNEAVEQTVYSNLSWDTEFYEHTFGIRDAAETMIYNKSGDLEVDTYIKPKAMYSSYYEGSMDNRGHIVGWLDGGHKGYYKNAEINYKGQNFFALAFKKLAVGSFLKKNIQSELRHLGYVISRNPTEKE